MFRAGAGVVVGYLVMALFVFVALTAAYLGMGTERAFKPGSFEISSLWLGVSLAVGLLAAIGGGLVCSAIAGRASKAPMILAGLVVVLGLAMAAPALRSEAAAKPRTGEVKLVDAMTEIRPPQFLHLINPLIGAVGVMLGARLRGSGHS